MDAGVTMMATGEGMPHNPKLLLSVYNISGYMMAGVAELLKRGCEVAIVERPWKYSKVVHEAYPQIKWIDRDVLKSDGDLLSALNGWTPDKILSYGWFDKLVCRTAGYFHRRGATTIVGVDNPWEGTPRQICHCMISRFYLTRLFDCGWGAGEPQVKYLRLLGFGKERARPGFYAADTKKFAQLYSPDRHRCPHRFIYVGRYVEDKNMRRMERAFLKAIDDMPDSDWVLTCIGGGALWEERTIHPRIEHLGYKQPSELQNFIKDSGCFVLPSVVEHWGVVVHEFALVGLPLICSENVMATTAFLREGENGFLFDPFDVDSIAGAFSAIMRLPDDVLRKMGDASHRLGMNYTTGDWAERLLAMGKEDE